MSQPYGPPPQPGFHYGGPPPQRKSRWWIWLIAAGVAVVVVVVVLVIVLSKSGNDDAVSASAKPDITALDEDMLIPRSDFPGPPGGEFHLSPVETNEHSGSDGDSCNPNDRWFQGETQETAAYFTYDDSSLRYDVELFVTDGKPDLQAWARECLPSEDYGRRIELPGLPPWAIATDADDYLHVLAYYRGVVVHSYIRGAQGASNAKSELANMFNEQIARLEAQ